MRRDESQDGPRRENWVGVAFTAFFAVLVFLFLPVMISALEYFVFGTNHFEALLRKLGLRRPLIRFYRWVLEYVAWFLDLFA